MDARFQKIKTRFVSRLYPRFGFDTPLFRLVEFDCFQTGNFFSARDTVWFPARQAPDFSAPPHFAGSLMPLFRACCDSLFRYSCLLIALMQTLPQSARLLPHSLIQCLDGLPQFQPVVTGPGIARWTVATASTAGWLRIVFAVASVSRCVLPCCAYFNSPFCWNWVCLACALACAERSGYLWR
jgi:hypothetical protein